ncbi:hypothetical protein RclHR1_03780005 [Rhizophagus clarus]|uniref:50S ribosomal protein L35 n=1 Tax=Rhizophagus clarus TaxID=94130 RepID=A0A2Z6RCF9_9GLOM|nr:hypothetical protein RclHR1_03780005 [Rhizophagus clarus]GES77530.1 ribosomal protein L35 [Rhizophagus clarus]
MSFLFNFGQRVFLSSVTTRGSIKPLFYNFNFIKPFSVKITQNSLLTNYTTQKNVFQISSLNTRFTIKPPIGTIFDNNHPIRFKSYKMKTHSGAKKRFRVLRNGKFKRFKAGKRHLNTGVSRSKIRFLSNPAYSHPSQMNHLKKLMPYA